MANGSLVEAVDLELDPVEATLADQVMLEQARGVVGEPAATEAGMDRDASDVRDPAADVRPPPEQRARTLSVELDHEQPALLGIAFEVLGDAVPLVPAGGGEKRAHVVVGVEVGEEVEVIGLGGSKRDGHGRAGAVARRGNRTAPDASATPPRISASPASVVAVISSSRIIAP